MLTRLRNLWKLSENAPAKELVVVKRGSMTPEALASLSEATGRVVVLSDDLDSLKLVPEASSELGSSVELGDGKAEYLGEGTEEEYLAQQREDEGLEKFYKRWGL